MENKTRSNVVHVIVLMIHLLIAAGHAGVLRAETGKIIQDAEYAIIEAQNAGAWAADDQVLDEKLAEIRKMNRVFVRSRPRGHAR
jgi:hypothetical protein